MAETILVKEALTKEMVDAGSELIHLLDKANLNIRASFWLYLRELNRWRLVVASPKVPTEGPRKVYKKIQKTMSNMRQPSIMFSDIKAVGSREPFISALRTRFRNGKKLSDMRVSGEFVKRYFIEDAYIYRIK